MNEHSLAMNNYYFALRMTLISVILVLIPVININAKEKKCLIVKRSGYQEFIFNRCKVCRVGTVIRSRPGSSVPSSRTYNIQARTNIIVPFKGPGASRLTRDSACEGQPGGPTDLLNNKKSNINKNCLQLVSKNNKVHLVNSCDSCRKGAVIRMSRSGQQKKLAGYALGAKQIKQLPSDGFSSIKLLIDKKCSN